MKILIICCFLVSCIQASPWQDLTATIAVVEYTPIFRLPVSERVALNTQKYIEIMKAVNDTKLDLIIFPEATLRDNEKTAVEIQMDNPCKVDTYPQFVKNLSCAAFNSQTYLVINLVEKEKCKSDDSQSQNCKDFGFHFYNTDLVFDRKGTIITRYRKYNLFGEPEIDKPKIAEKVVFETDFGIKFGIFTCFDILFKSPAQEVLEKNVDAIIFPSMWFSELPFLTALQAQQMWAYTHNVTLFAAGANTPLFGWGGSGIYAGSKSTIVEGFGPNKSKTFLFKSKKGKVPPVPPENVDVLAKEMDSFLIFTDPLISEFAATIVDDSLQYIDKKVCHNSLCCNFTLRTSKMGKKSHKNFSYTYFLVAFSGIRSFKNFYNGGIELCGIIACLNSSLSSCGRRFPRYEEVGWDMTIQEIIISADFENTENKTQFPNSLLSSIRPIDASETSWSKMEMEENGKKILRRRFSLEKPQNRLLTFAIYGRDFGRDFPPNGTVINKSWGVTSILLGCVGILTIFLKT